MVLGWRGPRSFGNAGHGGRRRWRRCWSAPLRMAYGTSVSPLARPRTARATAIAAAPAKLPTDLPWALATAVRPARIKVLAGAVDEAAAWRLFDGRPRPALAPDGQPSRFRLRASAANVP